MSSPINKIFLFPFFDVYVISAPLSHSIIHCCFNAFYLPYRVGKKRQLVNKIVSDLTDIDTVDNIAIIFNKTIYVVLEDTKDIFVYNKNQGIGCICLLQIKDHYDLISISNEQGKYVTLFAQGDAFIIYLNSQIK